MKTSKSENTIGIIIAILLFAYLMASGQSVTFNSYNQCDGTTTLFGFAQTEIQFSGDTLTVLSVEHTDTVYNFQTIVEKLPNCPKHDQTYISDGGDSFRLVGSPYLWYQFIWKPRVGGKVSFYNLDSR